jgi:hypothetical protein
MLHIEIICERCLNENVQVGGMTGQIFPLEKKSIISCDLWALLKEDVQVGGMEGQIFPLEKNPS